VKHVVRVFRVVRNVAGSSYPFDKTYFFNKEARDLLPHIFPHALVIAINKPFVGMIEEALKRAAAEEGKVYPMSRRDEDKLRKECAAENPIIDVVLNYKKYIGVVPVLFLQNRKDPGKKKQVVPQYLHAFKKTQPGRRGPRSGAQERADANMRRMMQNTFTGRSYFLSQGEEHRPVCSICTNSLAMITGQCHLGDSECFENLAQTKPSDYHANMKRFAEWVKRLDEPEITLGEVVSE